MQLIREKIRTIPDYPKKGIMFRDITTLLSDADGLAATMDQFVSRYKERAIDVVVGIEARGFIIGPALAYALGVGFVPIRKKGKLPFQTISQDYELEYGVDVIEMHIDAIVKGQRALLVDDLLATGGTAVGASHLIEKSGGSVEEACFIVELPALKGAQKLKNAGISYFALTSFAGE